MNSNNQESLEKAGKSLMLKEPFYGLFLIMLNKKWTSSIATAGVSKNGINFQLSINPDFWESLSDDHRIGILKHELMHITLFHLGLREMLNDHIIFNIAADLTINQRIETHMLPADVISMSSFPELSLKPLQDTKYYYDELLQAKNNNSSESLNRLIEHLTSGDFHPSHITWKEFDNLDESTKRLLQKQTEYIIKEAAEQVIKNRGILPGEIQNLLDKLQQLEPEKFNWKAYLRRFAGGSSKIYTKKLNRKYNKRYEDNPGLKIKQRKHMLVAIDTSGSVSLSEIKEFMNEIHHIYKTGSEVTIVQCDATIHSIEKFNPKIDFKLKGRGGTAFDPVIDYYNYNKKKYTSLVYFTDGECYANVTPLGRCLWVLSSRSSENNELPGQIIKLN
jgi:predicted metal-dependent peptidase